MNNTLFTNDRVNHSVQVGRLMYKLALVMKPNDEIYAQDMCFLGYIHDLGYEFAGKAVEHANIGYQISKNSNYKYSNEIYAHGNADSKYNSLELFLLNFADMITDQTGQYVTFDYRLNDIKLRHGEDSVAYQQSQQVIMNIKNNKFYNSLISYVNEVYLKNIIS